MGAERQLSLDVNDTEVSQKTLTASGQPLPVSLIIFQPNFLQWSLNLGISRHGIDVALKAENSKVSFSALASCGSLC